MLRCVLLFAALVSTVAFTTPLAPLSRAAGPYVRLTHTTETMSRRRVMTSARRKDPTPEPPPSSSFDLTGEDKLQAFVFFPFFAYVFYEAWSHGAFEQFSDPIVVGKAVLPLVVISNALQFNANRRKSSRD